jgi:hypothetical protein
MHLISNDELASRAGIDPWAEHQKLASGDPAQVEQLAATFAKAGGDMQTSNNYQSTAQHYVAEGYTVNGSSPVDFEAQVRATAASPEHMMQIGKLLAGIAGSLDTATNSAKNDISTLEGNLNGIDNQWSTFMQQIGHHLPPDDQQSVREELIGNAVTATRNTGNAIQKTLTSYEEHLLDSLKSLSDLGYVPPAQVDDLSGDAKTDIAALQKKARDLADKLKNNHNLDGQWGKDAHDVADQAAPFMDDPYFASAFYAELGPQLTQALPTFLQQSGSQTAPQDLKTFSHMFGTAVTNAADAPGMQQVADTFLRTPPDANLSWNRAVMVSNGNFPPDWLAHAARANALDDFAHHPGGDGFGGMGFEGGPNGPFTGQIGVDGNVVAAWTSALGNNPEAAREALGTMGNQPGDDTIHGDPTDVYKKNIHSLIQYGHSQGNDAGIAEGYSRAFEAASGADNEVDGQHSESAVEFAKALFNDMGQDAGNVKDSGIASDHFAKIGASYVQELAAGHGLDGDEVGMVDPNDRVLGDNAAFGIPPELAHKFMTTFVGNHEATQVFDKAAGEAAHNAMLAGAHGDVDLLKNGQSAHYLNTAAEAYGAVAGTENGAQVQVLGKQVEDEKHAKEIMGYIASFGVDMLPGHELIEKAPDWAWDAFKFAAVHHGVDAVYGGEPSSAQQLDDLRNETFQVAMMGDYERTSILAEAGYPGTDHIPADLKGPDGHMLSAAQVAADPAKMRAYYEYMHSDAAHASQGNLGTGASVYDMSHNAAGRYQYGYDHAPHGE